MELTDTHTHLYEPEFAEDREEVITRLKENQVTRVLLPNIDSASIEPMHTLADRHPELFHCMMGLHPTNVNENYRAELDLVESWLKKRHYCAIGEIGMDLYWDEQYKEEQAIAFETQIALSIEHNLPIDIHCRKAFEETAASIRKFKGKGVRGVFHSFTGTKEEAEAIFELGEFLLGINGIVTFKKAEIAHTLESIPMEKILLETDAPYLAPVPHRGKRNESSYLLHIAEKIAEIKGISVEEVAKTTTKNAINAFSL
ncbi:MAG: TatD family hydrolase [Paludibacteraceae bacterium]|nr:TatD family hydrolase [Paludibacteraceae bacterium]